MVYIGQAGIRKNGLGTLARLLEHNRNADKDYWNEAIVITTSDNSFGPTEISYLENRFKNKAESSSRFEVKNTNDPTQGNLTEEKESELEEFIEDASLLVGALGYKVFEPLIQATPMEENNVGLTGNKENLVFKIDKRGTNATGQLTGEGMVVHKGSIISAGFTPSCPVSTKNDRESNKQNIDENRTLLKDILFSSPSRAAGFVLGASASGYEQWKTESGKTLKEVNNV